MYFWCNITLKIEVYITLGPIIHKKNLVLKEYIEL